MMPGSSSHSAMSADPFADLARGTEAFANGFRELMTAICGRPEISG
jgi:hypothetical protein